MPLTCYVDQKFYGTSKKIIEAANVIISEYEGKGFSLTLRQLYYQFVARDLIKNNQKEYKRLGSIINDARLAGLIDWYSIEDRTRNLRARSSWDSPASIIDNAARGYHRDMWARQECRPEVWIEKDALIGVIERVCNELDVPYFACRGNVSQSEQWRAGRRLATYVDAGQIPIVLHMGDHDPSGVDMTRDNRDRLSMFAGGDVELRRLALNMDQIRALKPPPNPVKLTDSRANGYIKQFGNESWELDALSPEYIEQLIRDEIYSLRDLDIWDADVKRIERERKQLTSLAAQWPKVVKFINRKNKA